MPANDNTHAASERHHTHECPQELEVSAKQYMSMHKNNDIPNYIEEVFKAELSTTQNLKEFTPLVHLIIQLFKGIYKICTFTDKRFHKESERLMTYRQCKIASTTFKISHDVIVPKQKYKSTKTCIHKVFQTAVPTQGLARKCQWCRQTNKSVSSLHPLTQSWAPQQKGLTLINMSFHLSEQDANIKINLEQ